MASALDRLNSVIGVDDEKENTVLGRLNSLISNNQPANTRAKQAMQELLTTGQTTLHGKTYTAKKGTAYQDLLDKVKTATAQANDTAAAKSRFDGMTTDELFSYVPKDARDKDLYETYMDSRTKAAASLRRQSQQATSDAESAGYAAEGYREFLGMPGASDEELYGLAQAVRANNAQAKSVEPQKWLEYAEGLRESEEKKRKLTEQGIELGKRAAAASEQGQAWEYSNIINSYGELINSPDFAVKSQYNPDETQLTYRAINGDREAQNAVLRANSRTTGFSPDTGNGPLGYIGGQGDYLFKLTDTEKSIYNALYASSPEAADNFVEKLKPYLEARARDSFQNYVSAIAQLYPRLASAGTILAGVEQSGEYLTQIADLISNGKINQNSANYRASQMTSTVRGEVSKMAEAKWGKVGSAAYNLGMSMGDFLFGMAAGGGTKALSLGLMGTRAAANTVLNLKDRGLDDASAFTLGTIAGAAEVLTESFSLEKLLNPDLIADGIAKTILKNFLAEASEEGASDIINWTAERIYDAITGNNAAEWKLKVYDAIQNGADPNEAVLAAIQDNILQLGVDMLGGGISGGLMAGAGTPFYMNNFNASQQGQYANAIRGDEEGLQALIQSGLESPQNTESYQRAEKAENQTAKGKTPSALDVARLVEANQRQIDNEAAEQSGQGRFRLALPSATQSAPQQVSGLTLPARPEQANTPGPAERPQETQEAPRLTLPSAPQEAEQIALPLTTDDAMTRAAQAENDLVARLRASKPGLMMDDYANSIDENERRAIDETAKRLGLRIAFSDTVSLGADNAKIYGDGVVLVEKNNPNPVGFLYGHEMGHWLKQNSAEAYNEFAKAARATDPEWFKAREEATAATYRNAGIEISPERIQEEVLSDYAGWMVQNQDVLDRFINQNKDKPSVLRRLYEAIKALAAKLTGRDKQQAESAADLLLKAMNATEANVQNGIMSTNETHSSFGGIKAVYPDLLARDEAERLLGDKTGSAKNNWVRKKTGWFKGADGKWRFEIDDSGSRVKVDDSMKYLSDMDYELLTTLVYRDNSDDMLYTGEAEKLADLYGDFIVSRNLPYPSAAAQKIAMGKGTIGDILDHEELYRQYPWIAEIPLRLADLGETTQGQVQYGVITLNTSLIDDKAELRKTLLHEIQHIIQAEEGYAKGTNPRYWQREIDKGVDTTRPSERAAVKAYNRFKAKHPDFVSTMQKLDQMFDDNWRIYKRDGDDWVNRETGEVFTQGEVWDAYDKLKRTTEAKYGRLLDEYYNTLAKLGGPEGAEKTAAEGPERRTAYEMYQDTYGEAEARNVERRADLTPEQRKIIPPFFGDEDTVFVERGADSTNSSLKSPNDNVYNGDNGGEDNGELHEGTGSGSVQNGWTTRGNDRGGMARSPQNQSRGSGESWDTLSQSKQRAIGDTAERHLNSLDSDTQSILGRTGNPYTIVKTIWDRYQENPASADLWVGFIPDVYDLLNEVSDILSAPEGNETISNTADSDGNELSAGQTSYFADSKIRDKQGRLLVLYHGTTAVFTTFDLSRSGQNYSGWSEFGEGIYLTPNAKLAQFAADEAGRGRQTRVMPLYANLQNPFNVMDPVPFAIDDLVEKYSLTEADQKFLLGAGYRLLDFMNEHHESIREYLIARDYDGIWDSYNGRMPSQVVAYYENQVKDISNTNPTNDPDTKRSLKGLDYDAAPESIQNQAPAKKNDRVERLKFKYEKAIDEQKGKTFQANARRNSDLARQRREFQEQSAAQRQREHERVERLKFKYEQAIEEQKGKTFQEKARRYSELAAQKREFQEKEAKGREARRAQALRSKIASHTKTLLAEYQRPNDKHHIPEELRGAVNALLYSINMSSGYSLEDTGDGKHLQVPIGEGVAETKRTQAFAQLREQLASERNNLVFDWSMLDDADGAFNKLIGEMADIPIANMNSEQLQTVYDVLRNVEHAIKTSGKMLSKARWDNVANFANALRDENAGKKQPLQLNGKLGNAQKHIRMDILTPEAYFHRLGDSGEAVFKMLRDGQDGYIRNIKNAVDATKDILGNESVRKMETDKHTVTLGGSEVTMTTAQLMELYCLMARDQGMQHISTGGLVIEPSGEGIKKTTQLDPIHPTEQELNDAIDKLTPEQIRIAEAMQKYLTEDMSDLGNEATMKVYGYKKFGREDNYWKIRSNKNELRSDVEKDTQTTSVANKGFTKATKPNANTSVLIGSVFDTFSQSISDMATYSAWLAISEDLNRIRNYTFWDDNGNRITTIQTILDRVQGGGGADYFKQLMADIANGTQNDAGLTEGFVGAYKAAAIGTNLRVILQQPTAILRALEMIDPKYFANVKDPFKAFERAKKYAPIAQWKDWGYFDINTGRKMKDVLMDTAESALEKARQASMSLAGKADSWAWGVLWNAVERETAKTTDLTPGSDEFYQRCAERFGDIIDHTQVVDGVIQRAPIQRSKNSINKMASSFMSEPLKQYGQFMSAVYDVKSGKQGAGKHLVRTAMAMAAAGLLNNAVQSLVDSLRDDDKEKKYWEKFLEKFLGYNSDDDTIRKKVKTFLGSNMGELINPAEYIPYAKDIMSIYKGYDVERMDMSIVSDLVTSVNRLQNTLTGDTKYTVAYAVASVAEQLAKLTGLPAANIDRDIKSVINTVANEADIPLLQYYMNRYRFKPAESGKLSKDLVAILWSAKQKGEEDYQAVYNRLVKDGYSEDEIVAKMMSKLSETTGLTQAIKDADAARNANKSYDTVEKLSAFESLNLPQDEAEALLEWELSESQWEKYITLKDAGVNYDTRFGIMQTYSELDANDEMKAGEKALEFSRYVDSLNLTSKQNQLVKATYKFWSQVPAEATRYETFKVSGLSEDKSKHITEVLGALQPLPGKEAVTDMQRYRAIEADKQLTDTEKIKAVGSIMGTDMVTAAGNPTQWAKFKKVTDSGVSIDRALQMIEDGSLDTYCKWMDSDQKRAGITADTYLSFVDMYNGAHSDDSSTKQDKVVAYIDGLKLTADQKDSLYLIYYKESGLPDTPWHKSGGGSGSGKTYAPAKLRLPSAERSAVTTARLQLPTAQAMPTRSRLRLK